MKGEIQNSKFKNQKAKTVNVLLSAFCFLILGAGCGDLSRVRYGQETVKMAVLPAHSLERMTERYLPLLRHLSSETGYDVQYVSSNSYGGFGATVQGSDVHLVMCDPLAMLTLQKAARAEVLAVGLGANGSTSSPGLIVVRAGGAGEIGGLTGKKVGLASQLSAEGFLSQACALMGMGIDARRDLRLVPCGNMDEVVKRLLAGKIDAGFIGPAAWDDEASQGLQVLARTEPVPNWAVAALPGTAPEIKSKVQAALLAMGAQKEENRRILGRLRLEGFARPAAQEMEGLAGAADKAGIPY